MTNKKIPAASAEFEPPIAHNVQMLNITFSNKHQALLSTLLENLSTTPDSPFAAEQIIVPSAAIRRHLELAMATEYGICANVEFSYLGVWIWRQLGKVFQLQEDSPFAPETLAWRILRILNDRLFVQSHPRLKSYLEQSDTVMRYELALKVASLLEQTMTYRPELIDAWSENKLICVVGGIRATAQDQRWQAELWRRIAHEVGGGRHLPALLKRLASLDEGTAAKLRNGGVTHIYCPSAIAPLHIDILNQLGKWMDLQLYVQNPCREYWFDIVDRRRLVYLKASGKADYHESGNHLLSSWGKQTQAMIDLLFENTALSCDQQSVFVSNADAGKISLLAQMQDAILELRDLPDSGVILTEDDRSIEIHACHSLTRELEVLQDQLLAMFANNAPPAPGDILVVTPDLEQAAPLIDAVFGTASSSRRIPYTITGLGSSRTNMVATALLDLLSLASSRFTASAVFDLLQQPIVAQKFGIDQSSLASIHGWIAESAIRWGLDASHRGQLGLPETERYTFGDGLHRLFLGYALPSEVNSPYGNRLPAGNPEGADASALGSFSEFVRELGVAQKLLSAQKSAREWMDTLLALIDSFMAARENQIDDLREVQDGIRKLFANMQTGGGDILVDREVVLTVLKDTLDEPARGGIPFGVVTFTSMSSLRNLSYRIICVLGLNDGGFPTTQRPAEFDLMALAPKRGDRQRRVDERNLFLDLLLAAQERLYLSYTGRSIRDNSVLPPSVLISDLLDYVIPAIEGDSNAARKRLVVEHPLQPFSVQYFTNANDTRVASSNDEYFRALNEKRANPASLNAQSAFEDDADDDGATPEATLAFFDPPRLAEPAEEWRNLSLDNLLRFFRNPSRYLLRERLGITFADQRDELEDDETFLPDWEARNAMADRLLPLYLQGVEEEKIRASAMAGTEYPPGDLAYSLLLKEMRTIASFANNLAGELSTPCLPPVEETLEFAFDDETWKLSGSLAELRPSGLISYRYADVQAQDYLNAWICHLFLNAAAPEGVDCSTIWHGRDKTFNIPPIEDAKQELQKLIGLYRTGLSHPLRFFPRTAWEFIDSGKNFGKAKNKWRSWDGEFGESLDPSYRQSLRGVEEPLDDEFVACADFVFGRLNQLLKEDRP